MKERDDAFIKLKEVFLSAPVIQMPDTSKQFFVMTDASLTASGGVLMQKMEMATITPVPTIQRHSLLPNGTMTFMTRSS